MAFDPDAYLASSSAPAVSTSGFDPDAYLGNSSQGTPPSQPMSWQGLGQNALTDIGNQIKGVGQMGAIAGKTMYDLATGPSPITSPTAFAQNAMQTPEAQAIKQMPSNLISGVKSFAQDPVGSMYRNPVTTALTAGAIGTKLAPVAQTGMIKGMSAALGPSQEAIEARMSDPAAIQGAQSYADLAQKLPDTLNTLKDQISQHADQAASTLRDSYDPKDGAIPKNQVNSMFGDLIADLKINGSIVGPSANTAVSTLKGIADNINSIGSENPNLSEMDIKQILHHIDGNINWLDKGASATNSALTDFRGKMDQMLKSNNPEYAQAMQPVADKLGLLNALKKAFSITNQTGEGLQPTDATISKIQSLPTERKSVTQGLASQLANATGQDYTQQAKNYGFAKQFQGGTANGSRRVMGLGGLGAGIGAKLGGTPGAIAGESLGNVAGLIADKYGGSIVGGLADKYAPLYRGISQLNASAPAQATRQTAITALLNRLYAQPQKPQGTSQ